MNVEPLHALIYHFFFSIIITGNLSSLWYNDCWMWKGVDFTFFRAIDVENLFKIEAFGKEWNNRI